MFGVGVKTKKEILKKLKNTYCRLKKSNVSGVGVFAIRDIPKGINPFGIQKKQVWIKFNVSELKKVDQEVFKMISDFFVIEKDKTVYIPKSGLNGMDISFFVNNSKNPNLKVIGDGIREEIHFVTNQKIKKGEELLAFYGIYDESYKS